MAPRLGLHSIYIFSFLCIVSTGSDPCTGYANFNVTETSAPRYKETTFANSSCDSTIEPQWYRIFGNAGTDLATSGVNSTTQCGTQNPLWMNGSIPGMSDGEVNRTVCVLTAFSPCHTNLNVKVKNCCEYRVYYLVQATGCPQSYCVDDVPVEPCSSADNSDNNDNDQNGQDSSQQSQKDSVIVVVVIIIIIIIIIVIIIIIIIWKCKKKESNRVKPISYLPETSIHAHHSSKRTRPPPAAFLALNRPRYTVE